MKGNIGIGVLTMPIAISNAGPVLVKFRVKKTLSLKLFNHCWTLIDTNTCSGLVGGVLGMVFVAVVTIHCMHTLVIAAQKLVREK